MMSLFPSFLCQALLADQTLATAQPLAKGQVEMAAKKQMDNEEYISYEFTLRWIAMVQKNLNASFVKKFWLIVP